MLRHVLMAVLPLITGSGLVAGGVFLIFGVAPGGDRDLRAYEASERCASAPFGPDEFPQDVECRWTREFTVLETRKTRKKGELDSAILRDANGSTREVFFPSRRPVFDYLSKGERVTGTFWRGELTEVAAEGASQGTDEAPTDMRARSHIGALIILPGGVLMVVAAAWRLMRPTARHPAPFSVATLGLAYGLLFGGLFCPLLGGAFSEGEDFRATFTVWVPMASVMTAAAVAYARHLRDQNA